MNNFKNLPSDVLNNIFEYYNPYKTDFTNNIIKKNVLHNAVKRSYIKNINDDCIKCLYNFIFDINLDSHYSYMDITKITYKSFNSYYHIYYNDIKLFVVCIVNKNEYNIINQQFWFHNKCYNHYLVYISREMDDGYCYCGNEYKWYHNIGISYEENDADDNNDEEVDKDDEVYVYEDEIEVYEEDEEETEESIRERYARPHVYAGNIKDYFNNDLFIIDFLFKNMELPDNLRNSICKFHGCMRTFLLTDSYFKNYTFDNYLKKIRI